MIPLRRSIQESSNIMLQAAWQLPFHACVYDLIPDNQQSIRDDFFPRQHEQLQTGIFNRSRPFVPRVRAGDQCLPLSQGGQCK